MKQQKAPAITFAELCEMEPLLQRLYDVAKAVNDMAPRPCANKIWYGGGNWEGEAIKYILCKLVGYARRIPGPEVLRTREAYDVAYDTIYDALPDCDERCCYRD